MSKSCRKIPAIFMITLGILTLLIFPLVQSASAVSPYDSGYNHGCSDAQLGGHPYLDTPGKGPSFHTGAFMQGYDTGYTACSGASGSSNNPNNIGQGVGSTRAKGVNWEQLCIDYGGVVGIHTPCNQLAHGTILTALGRTALVCLLGGGVALLGSVDPATLAILRSVASHTICP